MRETTLETDHGPARLVTHPAAGDEPALATLLLSHGAGGGIDARDLEALTVALPDQGFTVVLLEQPWRVAGRKIATAPPTLDAALRAAATAVAASTVAGGDRGSTPLVVGGRSAGARSACRSALAVGAVGVLALSFPLHPPGRPEKSRLPELRDSGVPTLVVQGERDPMGRPEELPDLEHVDLAVVPGGDHGLTVPARGVVSAEEAMGIVVQATLEWLVREVVGVGERPAG